MVDAKPAGQRQNRFAPLFVFAVIDDMIRAQLLQAGMSVSGDRKVLLPD